MTGGEVVMVLGPQGAGKTVYRQHMFQSLPVYDVGATWLKCPRGLDTYQRAAWVRAQSMSDAAAFIGGLASDGVIETCAMTEPGQSWCRVIAGVAKGRGFAVRYVYIAVTTEGRRIYLDQIADDPEAQRMYRDMLAGRNGRWRDPTRSGLTPMEVVPVGSFGGKHGSTE